jgi:hypothetical protein
MDEETEAPIDAMEASDAAEDEGAARRRPAHGRRLHGADRLLVD